MRKSMGECSASPNDIGAAAVEFALIAVVFVTLLIGVVQFGFTFFEYIQVAHAAREGVRWAALGEPGQVITRATQSAPGLDPALMNITITTGSSTDAVRVTVSYPRTNIVPLPNGVVLPAVITSVAEERAE
ncbi:MAG TPA: TadE family protein [Coriobacteriia bacterium]|nr:TadE family protein [Coriobacteriia bacterium]